MNLVSAIGCLPFKLRFFGGKSVKDSIKGHTSMYYVMSLSSLSRAVCQLSVSVPKGCILHSFSKLGRLVCCGERRVAHGGRDWDRQRWR